MNRSESDDVVPVHAESFFSLCMGGEIHQRLCFEYRDPHGHYRNVLLDDELYSEEVARLSDNMQFFLDEEHIEVNNVKVRSVVNYMDIFLKGNTDVVAIVYLIDMRCRLKRVNNRIEFWSDEETAAYDYEILWRFPCGSRVLNVESQLQFELLDDMLLLWAWSGDHVGGHELIEFSLPPSKRERSQTYE